MKESLTEVRITLRKSDPEPGGSDSPLQVSSTKGPVGPYFADESPRFVTAAIGAPVHIPCKARNLGAKSVSLIEFYIWSF